MDRIYSAQLDHELTPWINHDDDFEADNINRHEVKFHVNYKAAPIKQKTDGLNQMQIKKFHQLMELHRERLRGKKMSNARSMEIMEKDQNSKVLPTNQKINQTKAKELQYQTADYRRSNTLSRLNEFQPTKIKSFHPLMKDSMEHEREIIKAFYRTKTGNRNADKFYGTLNKKPEIVRPKFSSTVLLSKYEMGDRNLETRKINSATINKTNPVKQIVQIKLTKYRSSRSIQKLSFQAKGGKKKEITKGKVHVLDRILVSI